MGDPGLVTKKPVVEPGPTPQDPETNPPLPADDRPFDDSPVHTADLPATPIRDRNIPAEAWVEAPAALLAAGKDILATDSRPIRIAYKRRLGPWLLWRAGPARGDARYVAVHTHNLDQSLSFRLHHDGTGSGTGADGIVYNRFRDWKRTLLVE